jgi:predicted transcriptional regulator
MSVIYQPIIIEYANKIIESLVESNFFEDYEIGTNFAKKYISDALTEKFINGELEDNGEFFFTDEEFEKCLKEIITGSILIELKEKGFVNSYEDEETDEMFFLTEEGKKLLKKNNE